MELVFSNHNAKSVDTILSLIDACKLNRNTSMSVFRGLLILSLLIIHNLGRIEGGFTSYARKGLTAVSRGYFHGSGKSSNKLERKVVNPQAAHGFFTLNSTYNKYESPDMEVRVGVHMEPTFVIEIDSMAWRMELEIKLVVTWQDSRIWWRKDNITNPGDSFTFEPSILQ